MESSNCGCNMVDCLLDAGCSKKQVDAFIEYVSQKNIAGQLLVLTTHRKELLDALHQKQAEIDCLDYIIFKLKKKEIF